MSIDMGQADRTLRQRTVKAASYDWTQVVQVAALNRGDRCVVRQSNGVPEILKIEPQWAYKEWVGCFSFIGG
jgi:hypothetical protein